MEELEEVLPRDEADMTNVEKGVVAWWGPKGIDEVCFGRCFLADHPMRCVGGRLYSVNGVIQDEDRVRRAILQEIEPVAHSRVAKKVEQILSAIKLLCLTDKLPMDLDRIHVANGTMYIPWNMERQKEFCLNRIPVALQEECRSPDLWMEFLHELLEDEDILTLQEYLGYCLQPTNRAQKMMILVGKGGEGKSVLGQVLRGLFGDNLYQGSIQKIETDRFARADLQYKLLMIDDDLKLEALPQTNNIKSLVTLDGQTDLERKGKQSYQGHVYARFLCFGNGSLSALYDRSYGFYRRQLILRVKDPAPDRKTDPYLAERLKRELEGILLWCVQGLHRLIWQNFQFTVSKRTQQNMDDAMRENNNILDFLDSQGYLRFAADASAPSRELCLAYGRWCQDNSLRPLSDKSLLAYLKDNQDKLGISYTAHVPNVPSKSVRGFLGVGTV